MYGCKRGGAARICDLATAFGVSKATVTKHLELHKAQGSITREPGVASLNPVPAKLGAMVLPHQENLERKHLVGKHAASLVTDGETIILDVGTTTTIVTTRLTGRRNLNVMTNALKAATILRAAPGNVVHLPVANSGC